MRLPRLLRERGTRLTSLILSNAAFFKQLRAILRIVLPRLASKESFLLLLQSFFLVFRTYLSLLGAQLDGLIVKHLVSGNAQGFAAGILQWYLLAIPSAYTNAFLKFLQGKLSLAFRYVNLLRVVHLRLGD